MPLIENIKLITQAIYSDQICYKRTMISYNQAVAVSYTHLTLPTILLV